MNSLNNNNNNNNNNVIINSSSSSQQQQQPCTTMAANTSSSGGGGFAKGLSLFASIGAGHCNNQMPVNSSSSSGSSPATALNNHNSSFNTNNNNSIYNNNQSEAGGLGRNMLSDNVVLTGNLRKLKTMKKKFFVLYRNAPNRPARLEYFDSEKKYRLHASHPKRSIRLEACFNINRRTDTKHKCVIALYTNEDCFCIVCDNEQELEQWLHKMLSLQNNKDENGEPPKPAFGE